MVNFTEIKERIQTSFDAGEGVPDTLPLDVPAVGEFLAGLELDGESLAFSQPDDQSLAIPWTKAKTVEIPGVLPGKLTLDSLNLTLSQGDGDGLGVALAVAGYFKRKSSQKRLDLTGALVRGSRLRWRSPLSRGNI